MESTTAVCLSTCILELGNYAVVCVKAFRDIYKSPPGQDGQDAKLQRWLTVMRQICKELSIDRTDDIPSRAIPRIQTISTTLRCILKKCQAKSSRSIALATHAKIRTLIGQAEIEHHVTNLRHCRDALSFVLAVSTARQLRKLNEQVEENYGDDIRATLQELILQIRKGSPSAKVVSQLRKASEISVETQRKLGKRRGLKRQQGYADVREAASQTLGTPQKPDGRNLEASVAIHSTPQGPLGADTVSGQTKGLAMGTTSRQGTFNTVRRRLGAPGRYVCSVVSLLLVIGMAGALMAYIL